MCLPPYCASSPYAAAATVEHGRFRGWRWLATMERRSIKSSDWREEKDLIAKRYCVMEVRDVDDRQAFAAPPVASGDLRMWKAEVDPVLAASVFARSQPLVGIDREFRLVGDGRHSLGVPTAVLVPTAGVIASLGIHPGELCTYYDREGIGLALVTWRAEYEAARYELARPRIRGSGDCDPSGLARSLGGRRGQAAVGVARLRGRRHGARRQSACGCAVTAPRDATHHTRKTSRRTAPQLQVPPVAGPREPLFQSHKPLG